MNQLSEYSRLFLNDTSLLDIRAPIEFEKGAFPQSVNIPLMGDDERHQVGICYKKAGQEAAIELGRQLVSVDKQRQRVAQWKRHIEDNPDTHLYCFRGGLRSRIAQTWLQESGLDVPVIKGGYKALRRYLIETFSELVSKMQLVVISGRTGTGKTNLLRTLSRSIDLEGLARHRGSSFGAMASPQPAVVDFENQLAIRLIQLMHQDSSSPIYIEGEGRLVGRLTIPEVLWHKMCASPSIVLTADLSQRVDIATADYVSGLLSDIQNSNEGNSVDAKSRESSFQLFSTRHKESLEKIRKRLGGEKFQHAQQLLDSALMRHQQHNDISHYRHFIGFILTEYYDPMYDYQLAQRESELLFTGDRVEMLSWIHHYESK